LEYRGLTVIRFNDADVKVDMNNVLMAIEGWIERNNPLTPLF
jgi:very-short-patch-repair endonuclease